MSYLLVFFFTSDAIGECAPSQGGVPLRAFHKVVGPRLSLPLNMLCQMENSTLLILRNVTMVQPEICSCGHMHHYLLLKLVAAFTQLQENNC